MSNQFPTDLEFDEMRRNVVGNATAWDRKSALVRKICTVGAVGAVALAGAGLAWVALASPELRENAVYCYSEADQNSQFSTVVVGEADAPGGLRPDAVELCATAWASGAVGQPTAPPPPGVVFPVPALQACMRLDGVTAVFPSNGSDADEFCRELGLRAK